jgi:hypothetical protein
MDNNSNEIVSQQRYSERPASRSSRISQRNSNRNCNAGRRGSKKSNGSAVSYEKIQKDPSILSTRNIFNEHVIHKKDEVKSNKLGRISSKAISGGKSNNDSIYTLHELTENENMKSEFDNKNRSKFEFSDSSTNNRPNVRISTYNPELDNYMEIEVTRD